MSVSGLAAVLDEVAEAKESLGSTVAAMCIAGPTLEASVSCVAIAQTELGHSRSLHRLARRASDNGRTAVESAFLSTEERGSQLVGVSPDWLDLVAAFCIIDVGLTTWLRAIADMGVDDLTLRAINRILEEEEFHEEFARGWVNVIVRQMGLGDEFAGAVSGARERFALWQDEIVPVVEGAELELSVAQIVSDGDRVAEDITGISSESDATASGAANTQ